MFLIVLWILVSIWIFYTDIFFRVISNIQIIFIGLLITFSFFIYDFDFNLWTAFIVFFVGVFVWRFGILGAGDVKLISTLIFIMPYDAISLFLFLISIIGAMIAIFIYICAKFKKIEKSVPYGVAIMSSFLLLFLPLIN
ncbi:prepilin peptidase [Helicobacter cappadocius]|uniref:Prepilin type IV endopeptidase peptidase domain-containing protein n=1 Tax=Helicobacter cappadocius TaxID=3063998 RepID=A0AA90T9D3_9HELI|nr:MULTISPECIES: prepilin peptidase [unclassified Helicobacter]MDO7253127.1 hypothetical protein [Helicobacter sp. faydin-H75]MDP2538747.1 hypothetical protein [Helicobacter sp. faydin-H76]